MVAPRMIVAVAGASGFVGSHLVKKLRDAHVSTRVLVRHKTGSGASETFIGDVVSGKGLDDFLSGVDVLVNLVGRFPPPFAQQYALNTLAVHMLCDAAVRAKVKKVIHISAAAAYGSAKARPFNENDPLQPDTSYGLSKMLGEEIVMYFSRMYTLHYVILRPTNIYGSGSLQGATHSFVTSYRKDGKLTVTGDGEQARDFVHVVDVVDAIYKAVHRGIEDEVLNISFGKQVSLNGLVKLFEKVVGRKIPVERKPSETGYVRALAADNSKAKKLLGWQPMTDLETGIKELLHL